MANWSDLPEELLLMIAFRLFSVVELLRFRSICTSWRSSVSVTDGNPFPGRHLIQLNPLLVTRVITEEGEEKINGLDRDSILSRASFFRVSSSSSSSSQGWLIKYEEEELNYGNFPLLNPLSRFRYDYHWWGSIDLYECKVSEIQASYIVKDRDMNEEDFGFKRVVLDGNNRLLGVGCDGKIRYWNGDIWTRVKDQIIHFCDIIVQRGLTYALDSKGIVWWISSSLSIYRYGPTLDGYTTNGRCFRELSLVESCGEFYIVVRLFQHKRQRRNSIELDAAESYRIHDDVGNTNWKYSVGRGNVPITVGFEVYKMDEESVKWVQVKSLGDNAFVVATDACFSVLAHEFYGCVPNTIYFSDNERYEIKVFNLDDASINTISLTTVSGHKQSCFQMFAPPICP